MSEEPFRAPSPLIESPSIYFLSLLPVNDEHLARKGAEPVSRRFISPLVRIAYFRSGHPRVLFATLGVVIPRVPFVILGVVLPRVLYIFRALIHLLNESRDPLILSVAAHDLGEYVRHYPRGKQ